MNGRAGRLVLGLIVLLIGLGWFLQVAGLIDRLAWDWLLPAILVVVGVALIADAKGRRHGGLIALGVILTLILMAGGGRAVTINATGSAIGERSERITSMTDLKDTSMFAGSLTLDLRDLDLPSGTTNVDVGVFAGEITIRVPSNATVEVSANTLFGEINVFGEQRSGMGVGLDKTSPGNSDRTLVLNVSAFAGQIGVSR